MYIHSKYTMKASFMALFVPMELPRQIFRILVEYLHNLAASYNGTSGSFDPVLGFIKSYMFQ